MSKLSGCDLPVFGRCIPVQDVYSDHKLGGVRRISPASVCTSNTRCGCAVLSVPSLDRRDHLKTEMLAFLGPSSQSSPRVGGEFCLGTLVSCEGLPLAHIHERRCCRRSGNADEKRVFSDGSGASAGFHICWEHACSSPLPRKAAGHREYLVYDVEVVPPFPGPSPWYNLRLLAL